jgi:hypothetical protein
MFENGYKKQNSPVPYGAQMQEHLTTEVKCEYTRARMSPEQPPIPWDHFLQAVSIQAGIQISPWLSADVCGIRWFFICLF